MCLVAFGIRCKRDGRVSDFMVMLGGGSDILGTVVVPGVHVSFVVTNR
jgi:hypothetical protein